MVDMRLAVYGLPLRDSLHAAIPTKLDDFSAITFRGPARRCRAEIHSDPTFLGDPEPCFATRICFAIECLSYQRRSSDFTEKQHLDLKLTSLGADLHEVPNANLARRFHRLIVGSNPAQLTGSCSQATRFEESGGPEPFVDPNAGHSSILMALPQELGCASKVLICRNSRILPPT